MQLLPVKSCIKMLVGTDYLWLLISTHSLALLEGRVLISQDRELYAFSELSTCSLSQLNINFQFNEL